MKDQLFPDRLLDELRSGPKPSRARKPRKAVNPLASGHASGMPAVTDSCTAPMRTYPATADSRQLRLRELREFLLGKFTGIDTIIDDVLARIHTWYVHPERITRPLVVNLWGTTGVGKTSLVRAIRDYLGFAPVYLEIALSNKENGYDVSDEIDMSSSIGTGVPGIILFDEFQRMRTKDPHGDSIRGLGHQDIWQILSDGMVHSQLRVSSVYSLMGRLNWSPFTGFGDESKPDNKDSDSIALSGDGTVSIMENILGMGLGQDPVRAAAAMPKDMSILQSAKKEVSTLLQLLRASGVTTDGTLEGVLRGAYSLIAANGNQSFLAAASDYTKCLIFNAGNLDELYSGVLGEVPIVAPADYVSSQSSQLSVPDVKEALGKLFFPEQVARLGNIHLTYSTINSSSYRKLVEDSFRPHSERLRAEGYTLDRSIHDLAYRNGVYPLQGVRPLFSTVTEILSEVDMAIGSLGSHVGGRSSDLGLTISYSLESLSLLVGQPGNQPILARRYIGGKDAILLPLVPTDHYVQFVSTHEAGHIVAHYVLTGGLIPIMSFVDNVRASTLLEHGGSGSPSGLGANAEATLAGRAATELAGLTSDDCGHVSDFNAATEVFVHMIRTKALGSYLGKRYGLETPSFFCSQHRTYTIPQDPHVSSTSILGPSDSSEACFVADLLLRASHVAHDVIRDNMAAVAIVAKRLSEELFLSKESLGQLLREHVPDGNLKATKAPGVTPPPMLR